MQQVAGRPETGSLRGSPASGLGGPWLGRSRAMVHPGLPLSLLGVLMVYWGFFCPDDLFIHLRFAQNLSQLGEWSFNPGEPVAGATSPPWVLLLAALHLLGASGPLAAKVLAGACAVGVVVIGARVVRNAARCCEQAAWWASFASAVMLAAGHWLSLWSAAGMETPLVPLLLLVGWAMLGARAGAVPGGLALGIATWSRPDAWPAAAVLLVAGLLWQVQARRWRVVSAFSVAAISWPVVSRLMLGSWLPITVAAKGIDGLSPSFVGNALARGVLLAASEGLPLLGLALIAAIVDQEVRAGWRRWLPLLAAGASYPASYTLNQALGGIEVMGRYLVPWFVLAPVACCVMLAPWWTSVSRRRWVVLAMALTLGQSLVLAGLHLRPVERYHRYHVESLVEAGQWLAAHAARDDLVLAGDIGVVGYLGKVQVLDPAGIVNPEAPAWARTGSLWSEIERRRPGYAINPSWFIGINLAQLEARTSRRIFIHEHQGYRWTHDPQRFTVVFRELQWPEASVTSR